MMIVAIHGDDALDRDERDEDARDEQLVGRRVEERPERRRHVPAAGEVAVDEVRDRRDGEQDARDDRERAEPSRSSMTMSAMITGTRTMRTEEAAARNPLVFTIARS